MSRKQSSKGKKKTWSQIDTGDVPEYPVAPSIVTSLPSTDVFFVDKAGNVEGSAHAKRLGSKKRRAEDAAPTEAEEEAASAASTKKARRVSSATATAAAVVSSSDGDEKRSGVTDTPARRTRSRTSNSDEADMESTPIRGLSGSSTPRDARSMRRMEIQKKEEERKLVAAGARIALLGKLKEQSRDTPKKLAARARDIGRQKDITGTPIVATPRTDKKKAASAAAPTPSLPSTPSAPVALPDSTYNTVPTRAGGKQSKTVSKKHATPKAKTESQKASVTPLHGTPKGNRGSNEKKKKKKKTTKKDGEVAAVPTPVASKKSSSVKDGDAMDTKSDAKKKKNKKKKSKKAAATAAANGTTTSTTPSTSSSTSSAPAAATAITTPAVAVAVAKTTNNVKSSTKSSNGDSKRSSSTKSSASSTTDGDAMDTGSDSKTTTDSKDSKDDGDDSDDGTPGGRWGRNGRRKAKRLAQRDLDRIQLVKDDQKRAAHLAEREANRLAKLAKIAPTFELPGPKTAARPDDAVPSSVRHTEKRREKDAARREAQRLNDLGLTAPQPVKLTDGSEIVDLWGNEFAQKVAAKVASKKINGFASAYDKPFDFEASRDDRAISKARAHVKGAGLVVAHAGQSFNPDEAARVEFAMKAFLIDEAERIEKERIEKKLRGRSEPPKRIVDDDDEDVEDEAERPDESRATSTKKLTKAERNKQERKRIHDQAELAKKKEKILKREIHKIPQIIKEMVAKRVEKVARDEEVAALKEANPLPLRLGRHEYQAPFPEVVLQEEIGVGSLREMKPSQNVVADQFNMFQAKNMIEPRKVVKNRRRYQLKEYEKHKDGVSTAMFREPKRT